MTVSIEKDMSIVKCKGMMNVSSLIFVYSQPQIFKLEILQ